MKSAALLFELLKI